MDHNQQSRVSESKEGILVRVARLAGAPQMYVLLALRRDLHQLEHDVECAGNPAVNRMYAFIRRQSSWESIAADEYDCVASRSSCSQNRFATQSGTGVEKYLCVLSRHCTMIRPDWLDRAEAHIAMLRAVLRYTGA